MTDDIVDVAVIGAGAAGLMAALHAARAGASTVLLESTADGGRKILISGGGRCNILPSRAQPERYVTDSSPNSLRKMMRSWPLEEQRAFFERELGMGMELEPETGKLFPASHRARDVRDALVARVREAGADVRFSSRVTGLIAPAGSVDPSAQETWGVRVEGGPSLRARAVILATGGLSVPATGSDGWGLGQARRLGLTVNETYPALTPLTATPTPHADLAGVSLEVAIAAPGSRPSFQTEGGFLFTHRGWSGPTVLDASHLTVKEAATGGRQELEVCWTERGADAWDLHLQEGPGAVRAALASELPTRLADRLIAEVGVRPDTPLAQLRREDRRALVRALTAYPLPWTGNEGYKKAEVTGGGVDLAEVDPGTLECRSRPGLHLCGEILDAFGPIGGHNFLWAWATGRAAGLGAARRTVSRGQ